MNCVFPCPVDCIDLIEDVQPLPTEDLRIQEQNDLRRRYYAHIQREETRRMYRKGPVVRAEIDSELFARFSQQTDAVPAIEVKQKDISVQNTVSAQTTIELAKIRTQIKNWKNSSLYVKMHKTDTANRIKPAVTGSTGIVKMSTVTSKPVKNE